MNAPDAWRTEVLSGGDAAAVARAVEWLAAGEVVGLPTETVYGLAADATDARAVARIFEAKERPLSDPLIVHLPSLAWLDEIALLGDAQADLARRLVARFWPGPLTLVLPRRPGAIGDLVTAGSSHVAVRMSAHPVFRAVIEQLDRPLAAPSANRFGRISPTTAAHVFAELDGRIPLILDGGVTHHGLESTIVAPGEDGRSWRILRHGPITVEMLAGFGVPAEAEPQAEAAAVRAAPGQLAGHYAPRTPLVLVDRLWLDRDISPAEIAASGLLGWRQDRPARAATFSQSEYLSETGDLTEAASRLFAALRRLDESGVERIFAERVPGEGIGRAIMERLSRAAAGSGSGGTSSLRAAGCSDTFAPVSSLPTTAALPSTPPSPVPPLTAQAARSGRAVGIVGLAVMFSRVLGLVREQLLAGLFGAGIGTDAFYAAFRAPNLLRDLFAEGALSTAFITTFSKKIEIEGDASAWKLANKMATLLVVFMSAITVLGIVFSPLLIDVLAPGFRSIPGKFELTVSLTRIMYPFILLVSLSALVMGMLNAKHVFGAPAMASSFFNLGSIVGGVGLGWWLDPHFGRRALFGIAIGTLIGGLLQLTSQLPAVFRAGYRFRPDFGWRDDGVRTILRLMGPAVIAASAVQINVAVNGCFASFLKNGAVTWLNNSFRLMQLPLGIFGVAIATVTLPLVSKSAARGDKAAFRATLARALRLAFFLTIPSAVGLVCLGGPIISLIYQHGRYTAFSAEQTGATLQCYAIGLVAYAGIKVLAPAFYALDARTTPMNCSFISIGINVLLNGVFTYWLGWGPRGLALSTSLTAIVNFGLLYVLMRRLTGKLETRLMIPTLAKLALAGAALAMVCLLGRSYLLAGFYHFTFGHRCWSLLATIGAGGLVFFAACYVLRLSEMQEAVEIFSRKFSRARRAV
jgi:putative peptidoglycan lipid II flippase